MSCKGLSTQAIWDKGVWRGFLAPVISLNRKPIPKASSIYDFSGIPNGVGIWLALGLRTPQVYRTVGAGE